MNPSPGSGRRDLKTSGNIIFISGGVSGIARGLAEAFHKRDNKVIISGWRRANIDEVVKANPRMAAVEGAKAIRSNEHGLINSFNEFATVRFEETADAWIGRADAQPDGARDCVSRAWPPNADVPIGGIYVVPTTSSRT